MSTLQFCVISVSPSNLTCQASPSDPDNFPFVLLGNKVDIDGGNSRVVIIRTFFFNLSFLFSVPWAANRIAPACPT
jgi:hypothetical protein